MRSMLVLAAAAVAVSIAGAAVGQDVVAERQQLMKDNGAALGPVIGMVRGRADFNAEVAAESFRRVAANAERIPALFPEGSAGGSAAPEIWQNFAEFTALAEKLKTDAEAAAASSANGLEAMRTAFSAVNGTCSSCHRQFER